VNLNNLAKQITLQEGLKESISIAQVKEVMRLFFIALGNMTISEINDIIKKYK
jgi:hypothetical protein